MERVPAVKSVSVKLYFTIHLWLQLVDGEGNAVIDVLWLQLVDGEGNAVIDVRWLQLVDGEGNAVIAVIFLNIPKITIRKTKK